MIDFPEQLRLAKLGDSQALDRIICEFDWVVTRECRRLDNLAAADLSQSDMRQESWLRIWTRIDQFHFQDDGGATGGFVNWLRVTARNVVLTINHRRQGPTRSPAGGLVEMDHVPQQIAGTEETASRIAARKEEQTKLMLAIAGLRDQQAEAIIRMRFFDNRSLREIGSELGITYDQVRYAFHQALQNLATALKRP